MADYRIEFTITCREPGDGDFAEVGFGSSGAWPDIDAACHDASTIIACRQWETSPGMPAPESLPGQYSEARAADLEPLIDPDCRDGKHTSCVGSPCECDCHD